MQGSGASREAIKLGAGEVPPIHFAISHGARIAYEFFGEGEEIVVSVPPMAQNIEVAWEEPLMRAMFERFGAFARFLIFDKRGTGSSDRTSRMPGLDERVDDLKAVMDHAGVEQAHIMGTSEGGPMAIMFAHSYPERVQSLILHGTGPRLIPEDTLAVLDALPERRYQMADNWGTPESQIVAGFAPSLADNQRFCDWHRRYERLSATSDSLRDLIDLFIEIDVTDVVGQLDVPTLVQHRIGDQVVPVDFGRWLAANIPGARLAEYEGADHFGYVGDPSWISDIEEFVTGEVRDHPAPRPGGAPRIVTLGRFGVEVAGTEVPPAAWGSRRARQLLKRLVVARGWPVPREELIEMLWPGESDKRKLGARLSVQLSAVRRVLGGGVVADRQTVRLDLDLVDVDIETWFRNTDRGALVASYHEFLPEDRFEDWSGPVRDEARTKFVSVAHELINEAMASGDLGGAADLCRELIISDPFDDRAHQQLVACLAKSERMTEAHQAHERRIEAMAELDITIDPFEASAALEAFERISKGQSS